MKCLCVWRVCFCVRHQHHAHQAAAHVIYLNTLLTKHAAYRHAGFTWAFLLTSSQTFTKVANVKSFKRSYSYKKHTYKYT